MSDNDSSSYQEELQALRVENEQLRELEAKRVREQDFHKGSEVRSPPQVWVSAVNAINLFKGLHEGSQWALDRNDPWKKVVFTVTSDGQLTDARLEGT